MGFLDLDEDGGNRPVVGQITDFQNDTRHKSNEGFSWNKARQKQKIRVGDSVFTGANSFSRVELEKGGHVDLGSNTLVNFEDMQGIRVPNLRLGNFKLAVDGTMKVILDNKVTEISGKGSEVQIILGGNSKPQIRLLKGQATIKKDQGQAIALKKDEILRQPADAGKNIKPQLDAMEMPNTIFRTDEFLDFYERLPEGIIKRAERRQEINVPVNLQWRQDGNIKTVFGQVSNSPQFDRWVQTFESAGDGQETMANVFLGRNYWRISLERKNWTKTKGFFVKSEPLKIPSPRIEIKKTELLMFDEKVYAEATIAADPGLKHFVVEMSRSPEFKPQETVVQWSSERNLSWYFNQVGMVYIKARGVNESMQVTGESPVMKLSVIKPEKALPPLLAKDQFEVYENEGLKVSWDASSNAKAYEIELRNSKGEVIQRRKVKSPHWAWDGGKLGHYQAKVVAVDKYGRKSETAAPLDIKVVPKPVMAKKEEEKRKLASTPENTLTTKIENKDLIYLNRNYPSSKVTLESSGFTMYSSEQIGRQEQPVALLMGLRVQQWFGSHGAEGSLKTKTIGLNSASDQASPLQAEMRYHYRWMMGWNLLSKLKESQISAILGYELYRNPSGGSSFASQYDLLKAGFSLSFPFLHRWDTGGEVLGGTGFDQSKKYEIAGYLNYYLRRDWSMGVGYRLHLFEAGSAASSPQGLPYREGFGEAYSNVRWHY